MSSTVVIAGDIQIGEDFSIQKSFEVKALSPDSSQSSLYTVLPGDQVHVTQVDSGGVWKYHIQISKAFGDPTNAEFLASSTYLGRDDVATPVLQSAVQEALQLPARTTLSAPVRECRRDNSEFNRPVFGDHDPVRGARRYLATIYQSCLALDGKVTSQTDLPSIPKIKMKRNLTDTSLGAFVDHHYILSRLKALEGKGKYPGPGCVNTLKTPPVYAYGAKPIFNSDNGEIATFKNLASGAGGCPR